ncbi:RNA 2'-phosphotransferase [Alkalinema pantanalense CENA528]|uniref:RNA 2'-phosphotransferase n=1 Tax=Alkalinema pantanalense TaxID=1620705 RepID=UPI003D6FE115
MNRDRRTKVSKYLSCHLRHKPDEIGLQLEPGGWVKVTELLQACAKHGVVISPTDLEEIVTTNDKQRFSFNPAGDKIRANQGHTVEIDLRLEPQVPPDILYHGTGARSVEAILQSGLLKMTRHHVHLSYEITPAKKVGMRHGKPVVLVVDAAAMHQAGFTFYRSENGVWLTDHVPAQYICPLEDS